MHSEVHVVFVDGANIPEKTLGSSFHNDEKNKPIFRSGLYIPLPSFFGSRHDDEHQFANWFTPHKIGKLKLKQEISKSFRAGKQDFLSFSSLWFDEL